MTLPAPRTSTDQRILDATERLVQTRGFNAFSYADVAREIGITTASLHYHFPTKSDLGTILIERYERNFATALAGIDAEGASASRKLHRYAALYGGVLRNDRMCLCGMLAAEYATLPAPMQTALVQYFNANEAWLAAVLDAGRAAQDLEFSGDSRDVAHLLTASLEGAMIMARVSGNYGRFDLTAAKLLANLSVAPQPAPAE